MKRVDVQTVLEKEYKTRNMVLVAWRVTYEEANNLLTFLQSNFPRHAFHFFAVKTGDFTRYALRYSLNYVELRYVISNYHHNM